MSRQSSVLDFFKSSSETSASPHVLLGIGDGDPDDRPTVPEEVSPPHVVVYLFFSLGGGIFSKHKHMFYWCKQTVWNHPPSFNITFMGKSVSTDVAVVGTTYGVISGDELYEAGPACGNSFL